MKKQPPWKAENARIHKELAARKKKFQMVCKVVQIPARAVPLKASWIFDSEALFLPEEMRKDMARQAISRELARELAEELRHEFISMKRSVDKNTGDETWTGTLWAVRGDTESWGE